MARVTVAGCELFALNHTMSGVPGEEMTGFELMGPIEHKDRVFEALCAAGRTFDMRLGGERAYKSSAAESGWIPLVVPAIYTGDDLKPYREWLTEYSPEANGPLIGSFASGSIEDYYLTPWDMGYDRVIRFDHDFIGRDALEEQAKVPQRRKVWLRWDDADAARLMAQSLFGGAQRAKTVDLPNVAFGAIIYDQVLKDDRLVGFSTWGSYTVNIGSIVTLGMVGPEVADGDEVTIVWGEPEEGQARLFMERHVMSSVQARVSSTPLV